MTGGAEVSFWKKHMPAKSSIAEYAGVEIQ